MISISARRHLNKLPCATLAMLLAACSSREPSDVGATSESVIIEPDGGDRPGSLLVTLPSAVAASSLQRFTLNNGSFTVGVAKPQPTGPLCLELEDQLVYNFPGHVSDCAIAISAQHTTTYPLAVVTFQNGGSTLGIDPVPSPVSGLAFVSSIAGHDGSFHELANLTVARPPGKYHYSFGLFDGLDSNVVGNVVQTVDLSSLAHRRSLVITAVGYAAFPNPIGYGSTFAVSGMKGSASKSAGFVAGDWVLVGEYDDATPVGAYTLTSRSDAMQVALSANPGDPSTTVAIQRIDVDDVSVQQNDGTRVKTPGVYSIDRVLSDASGNTSYKSIVSNATTKTGVHVFPGTYRITTTYNTIESGEKTDVETETLGAAPPFRLTSVNSGKVLDISGASQADAAPAIQYSWWGGANQQWNKALRNDVVADGFALVNVNSGKCLDVSYAGTTNGSQVIQWDCGANVSQVWEMRALPNGETAYVNYPSGRCLDVSAASVNDYANVQLWDCWGGANQEWRTQ